VASFPRIRYDQLMQFCWTILLPLLFAFIIVVPCVLYCFNSFVFGGFAPITNRTPPHPHQYNKSKLWSGGKDLVLVIIGGVLISIPSSYLSIIKNFGLIFSFGVPVLTNIIAFAITGLAGEIDSSLIENINEISRLLEQLENFYRLYIQFITENDINVISDSFGNLDIEVPDNIDDETRASLRINVLDRLINHHIDAITDLLDTTYEDDRLISANNSNHTSQQSNLSEFEARLNAVKNAYKHSN
jgi:hypothetical protein